MMCFMQDLVVILLTVFGYLYAGFYMMLYSLSWSQLVSVDTDVGSVNITAEVTTVSAVSIVLVQA